MKGRYRLLERTTVIAPGVRATIRLDVWNGRALARAERKAIVRSTVDWVLAELEPPERLPSKADGKLRAKARIGA